MSARSKQGDPYKRGYSNGVMAAVEALFDDIDEHDAVEGAEYDETGQGLRCYGCMLMVNHFPRLADRWRFVTGIKC